MRNFWAMIFGAVLLASPVHAAQETFTFDKAHTNIMWFASHFGFSDSMGQFMDYDGKLVLDEENPENSSVEITIKTESIMTGLPDFDDHLRNKDFFWVSTYPTAKFVSTEVEQTGDNTAKVTGNLTMLDQTHPVTLDVTMNKLGTNPFNKKRTVGFSAKTTLMRSQWGMTYALPGIPDAVDILIETELVAADQDKGK